MARIVLIVLCFSLLAFPLAAYEPYRQEEFPRWAHNLRRGEIIFVGSLPITYGVSTLAYSLVLSDGGDNQRIRLVTALSLSLGIAAADFILGRIGR